MGGVVRIVGALVKGAGVGAVVGDEDVGENDRSGLQSVVFTISVMKLSSISSA